MYIIGFKKKSCRNAQEFYLIRLCVNKEIHCYVLDNGLLGEQHAKFYKVHLDNFKEMYKIRILEDFVEFMSGVYNLYFFRKILKTITSNAEAIATIRGHYKSIIPKIEFTKGQVMEICSF